MTAYQPDLRGTYPKFAIKKTDGSPLDPQARYFVLNYAQDRYAWIALFVYALLCCVNRRHFARELLTTLRCPKHAHTHEAA